MHGRVTRLCKASARLPCRATTTHDDQLFEVVGHDLIVVFEKGRLALPLQIAAMFVGGNGTNALFSEPQKELDEVLLSRRWSTQAAVGLLAGGVAEVAAAYVANTLYMRVAGPTEGFMETLVYFGPLFVVGGAFTTAIFGEQVLLAAPPAGGAWHTVERRC